MRVPVGGEALAPDRFLVGIGELGHRPSPRSSDQIAMELQHANRRSAGCPRSPTPTCRWRWAAA